MTRPPNKVPLQARAPQCARNRTQLASMYLVADTYASRVERPPIGRWSLIKIAHSPKFKLGHSLRTATKEDPSCQRRECFLIRQGWRRRVALEATLVATVGIADEPAKRDGHFVCRSACAASRAAAGHGVRCRAERPYRPAIGGMERLFAAQQN